MTRTVLCLAVGCVLACGLVAAGARADDPSAAQATPPPELSPPMDAPASLPPTDADASDEAAMPGSLPDEPALQVDDAGGPPLRFELNFVGALGYRTKADSGALGYGFGFTYGMGWGDIPLTLGLNFFSLNTQDHVSTIAFASQADAAGVLATQRARERTMHFDVWLRVQPGHWRVRPYVEGFWGAQLLQTQYSLQLPSDAQAGDAISDQAWVMNFGWGAGVDFWGLFNANHTLSLTLGVRQFFGGDAGFRRSATIGDAAAHADYPYAIKGFVFMLGLITVFDMGVPKDPYEPHRFD